MNAAVDTLLVEQAAKLARSIGGPERYRRSLESTAIAGEQWEELRREGWHLLLEGEECNLPTFCQVAERFGASLLAVPFANLAIAHRFVGQYVPPESAPVIALELNARISADFPGGTHLAIAGDPAADRLTLSARKLSADEFELYPHGAVWMGSASQDSSLCVDAPGLWTLLLLSSAAELVGIAGAVHGLALDYLKVRHQFGRPLGSFQALQHRAANDAVALAETRALVQKTAALDAGFPNARYLALAAISKALEAASRISTSSIQIFGAIGFAAEHDAGLYLKRTMHIERLIGTSAFYRQCFSRRER